MTRWSRSCSSGRQVSLELFLVGEGGGVDALELLLAGVAVPVSAATEAADSATRLSTGRAARGTNLSILARLAVV